MAYFNHAFGKAFYLKTLNEDAEKTSIDLNAGGVGTFGFLDGAFGILNGSELLGTTSGFYLAQSSFQTVDTIGNNPGHGGYQETTKSKLIRKKYITDMWITECNNETAATYVMDVNPIAGRVAGAAGTVAKSCLPCGTDPIARVDIKGTAALRLLNHNAYQSLSGSLPMPNPPGHTGSTVPTDGVDMCCVAQDLSADGTTGHSGIAPSIVAINFRDQFNNDPILSQLGTAKLFMNQTTVPAAYYEVTVGSAQETAIYAGGARGVYWSATNAAALDSLTAIVVNPAAANSWFSDNKYRVEISLKTSCELQTQFSSCSFDTRDFYLMGGLKAIMQLQDEVGNPCVACLGYVGEATGTWSATNPVTTVFKQRRTSADTAINDILMTENYRQSPYNQGNRDSTRFRHQEQMSGIVTELGRDATGSTCNGKFQVFHILHNIPRFNNPSGVFDNDQYHYRVYVPCGDAAIGLMSKLWVGLAIGAGVLTADGSGQVSTVTDLVKKGGDI